MAKFPGGPETPWAAEGEQDARPHVCKAAPRATDTGSPGVSVNSEGWSRRSLRAEPGLPGVGGALGQTAYVENLIQTHFGPVKTWQI